MTWKTGKENPSWVETPIKNVELLRKELFENKLSYQKIADKYNVNKTLIQKLVKKYGIKIILKDRAVSRYGSDNPNWKGGPKFCSKCGEIQIAKDANTCMGCYDKSGKNNPMYGKNHTIESKQQIKNTRLTNKIGHGKDNSFYGKNHTIKSIRKMRKSAIKRVEINSFNGGQMMPGYNPEACKIIEHYGNEHGYNFQHAENGGEYHIKELGYWVDGYDEEKNVVIEYYEKRHNHKKERDERRKQEIVDYLGCKFIEITE
ncbi:hypothetical protein H8D04_00325 [bacterium]|nr:hypothetical protein [bacterium]